MSAEKLKADAARLAEHLSTKFGYKLKTSAALEALAISRGFKDWNSCLAASLAETAPAPHLSVNRCDGLPADAQSPLPVRRQFDWPRPLAARALQRLGHTHAAAWLNAVACSGPGLYLLTGAVGSGVSTTFRAMADDLSEWEQHTVLLSELSLTGKPLYQVAGEVETEFRNAMRSAASIILAPEGLRDDSIARLALDAAAQGFTVVACIHGTSVLAAYRRMAALCANKELLDACLSGILLHQRLGAGKEGTCLLTELALFQNSSAVRAMEQAEEPTWATLLDDAVRKCETGRLSPYTVITEFGEEAVSRFKPEYLKVEEVRRALNHRN